MDKKLTSQEIEQAVQVCSSKKTGGSGCSGCPLQGERRCVNRLFDALAEENKRLREELRWIPVGERKPDEEYAAALAQGDEDVEVIAMIQGGDVATALRYDGDIRVFFAVDDGEFILYRVTHWKPMPKGPEAE